MKKQQGFESYTWTTADGRSYTIRPGEDGVTQADIHALYDADRMDGNNARKARRHLVSLDAIEAVAAGKSPILAEDTDMEAEVLERIILIQQLEQLQAAIKTLTDEQRNLLEQVYAQGLSLREIARREGVYPNSIVYRLSVILQRLKKFF